MENNFPVKQVILLKADCRKDALEALGSGRSGVCEKVSKGHYEKFHFPLGEGH